MEEVKLSQLNILPERGLQDQIDRFKDSRVLRLRVVAPAGVFGDQALEGWLDLKLSWQLAMFSSDAAEAYDERVGKGCAVPLNVAAVSFLIAMIAVMLFHDWCDGLFDPDDPSCYDTTIFSFPLFVIPVGVMVIALLWALVKLCWLSAGDSKGPEAMVEMPDDFWTLLGSFDEAIDYAKSGGKTPLQERAVGMGAGAIAKGIGDMIVGPMTGEVLKGFAKEATGDKQSRIAEAMEIVRRNMIDAVLAYCRAT